MMSALTQIQIDNVYQLLIGIQQTLGATNASLSNVEYKLADHDEDFTALHQKTAEIETKVEEVNSGVGGVEESIDSLEIPDPSADVGELVTEVEQDLRNASRELRGIRAEVRTTTFAALRIMFIVFRTGSYPTCVHRDADKLCSGNKNQCKQQQASCRAYVRHHRRCASGGAAYICRCTCPTHSSYTYVPGLVVRMTHVLTPRRGDRQRLQLVRQLYLISP